MPPIVTAGRRGIRPVGINRVYVGKVEPPHLVDLDQLNGNLLPLMKHVGDLGYTLPGKL
jgi:hypothetical protein